MTDKWAHSFMSSRVSNVVKSKQNVVKTHGDANWVLAGNIYQISNYGSAQEDILIAKHADKDPWGNF